MITPTPLPFFIPNPEKCPTCGNIQLTLLSRKRGEDKYYGVYFCSRCGKDIPRKKIIITK